MANDVRTLILPTDESSLRVVLSSLNSEVPGAIPDMIRADGEDFAIIIADPSESSDRPYDARAIPDGTTMVLGIGFADTPPDSGSVTIKYTGDGSGASVPYPTIAPTNAGAAAALLTVIMALPYRADGTKPVTVTQSGVDFIISDTTPGARPALTADSSLLIPLSAATLRTYRVGSDTQPNVVVLTIAQADLAVTTDYDPLPVAGYALTTIRAGTSSLPAIQRIKLDPAPYGGTFTVDSQVIAFNATDIGFAQSYGNGATVVKTGPFEWQFTQGANGAKASTVNIAGLLVPTGFLVTLNLSTYEFFLAFAKAQEDSISPLISFRVTFPGRLPKTYLLTDVNVFKSIIDTDNLVSAAVTGYPAAGDILTKSGNLAGLDDVVAARTALLLGTAATRDVGTAPGNVVAMQNAGGIGILPPVDGSQLNSVNAASLYSDPDGVPVITADDGDGNVRFEERQVVFVGAAGDRYREALGFDNDPELSYRSATRFPSQSAVRTYVETLFGGLPNFGIADYGTNSDKQAGTAKPGELARITSEASRIERFLGNLNSSSLPQSYESNWLVLRNTVSLTVNNYCGSDIAINGVICYNGTGTAVGWVDVENIYYDTSSIGAYIASITYGPIAINTAIFLDAAGYSGTFALPFAVLPRTSLTINIQAD